MKKPMKEKDELRKLKGKIIETTWNGLDNVASKIVYKFIDEVEASYNPEILEIWSSIKRYENIIEAKHLSYHSKTKIRFKIITDDGEKIKCIIQNVTCKKYKYKKVV